MPTIFEVVEAYMACGKAIGFFWAEMILMKYCPEDKPEGVCYDVPEEKRAQLVAELEKATAEGS